MRDALGVSDSVLSKHVKALQTASYLSMRKTPINSRTRTWLGLTKRGRTALDAHLVELQRIAVLATSST